MEKTSFTKMIHKLVVLIFVGMGVVLNAQSFSVNNVPLGSTACGTTTGPNPGGTIINIPITVSGVVDANTLASISLNYCSTNWVGDFQFDIIAPGATATAVSTGNGGTGVGPNNIVVYNNSSCAANLGYAVASGLANGATGNRRAIAAFSCPNTVSPNGTWTLVVRNTFGFGGTEAGFLNNATLTFATSPQANFSAMTGVVVNGGTIISATGPTIVPGNNCRDTILYNIVGSPGSTSCNATFAAPTAAGLTTEIAVTTGPVAGPYNVGLTRIRTDRACYNPAKDFVTVLRFVSPPSVTCPTNIVKTLAPGECTNQAAWSCPISSVTGSAAGPTFSQQTGLVL